MAYSFCRHFGFHSLDFFSLVSVLPGYANVMTPAKKLRLEGKKLRNARTECACAKRLHVKKKQNKTKKQQQQQQNYKEELDGGVHSFVRLLF